MVLLDQDRSGCPGVCFGFLQDGLGGFFCIVDRDERSGVIGLLLRLGNHRRDDLPIIVDPCVLHDRQIAVPDSRHIGHADEGQRPEAWHGLMRDYLDHAWFCLCRAGIQPRDPAPRDGTMHQRGIGQLFHGDLRRETRLSHDLERPVQTRRLPPDRGAAFDQRVGRAAWKPACGHPADDRPDRTDDGVLYLGHWASPARSRSRADNVRFASPCLKPLPGNSAAPANSASKAASIAAADNAPPRNAASIWKARHGLGAMPPNATRMSSMPP